MTESCILLFGVLFITVFPIHLQAATGISLPSYGNVTYVTKGSDVSLVWTYDFGVGALIGFKQWFFTDICRSFDVTPLISLNGGTSTIDSKSPFKNIDATEPATLVLKNVNLDHNGTYRFTVNVIGISPPPSSDILVIILEQPVAEWKCYGNNDANFYCVCKSDVGNPPPLAYWSKDGKMIGDFGYKEKNLTIDNIAKGEAATYSCNVKSHNLTDQKHFILEAPKIIFDSEPKDHVPLNTRATLTCREADGILPTMFNVSFNGNDPERIQNGIKIINKFTKANVGSYKCIAFNIIGSSSPHELKLNITEKSKCADSTGFEWYIILVTLVCGIIIGMIFHYGIMSLRQRFKSKKDVAKPAHNYDTPETHPEGAGDNSAYQELELKNREPENSYQALRMNTRRRIDNETKIEDEAGYQELDKVREKDNNYQSLNRV